MSLSIYALSKETSFKERLTQSQTDKSTSQLTQALSDLESLREEKEKFREELEATLNDSNSKLERYLLFSFSYHIVFYHVQCSEDVS